MSSDSSAPEGTDKMKEIATLKDLAADLGLTHVGFKDIGVDLPTLKQLAAAIRKSGATSYVEVVSTTPETIRRSIAAAASTSSATAIAPPVRRRRSRRSGSSSSGTARRRC